MNIGKNAFTLTVLLEIDFNKMGKQFLTHISNEIGFPNLTGTIDEKNLVAFFLENFTPADCTCQAKNGSPRGKSVGFGRFDEFPRKQTCKLGLFYTILWGLTENPKGSIIFPVNKDVCCKESEELSAASVPFFVLKWNRRWGKAPKAEKRI